MRSKNRLHHLCAAAIAIFSYLLSGDECKAVIKTLESKSPAITPSNGQYQTAGMFCQMSRKLHKITDHRTYSSAMYFLPAGNILLFQRFLPYDSKDIICDHCQLQHQFVALKLSQRESFNIPTDVTGNDTAGMVDGMVASAVTAKGLNGIEAEANKLAKAPKGIDGVTEKAGNLAEDVGKAGKGLEGAAKGAESAAEDAGKVVESGTYSGDLMSAEEAARYSEYWRELGIGSDNTWKAFKDANPNGTIDDYFEIVQKQSPWPLGETGTPTTLKAGDRFFMAVENNAPENVIGGFGVKERIDSTDFVRNNLAVKYDWKTSCNVIREFEVNSGIELNVNAGPVGPQIDLGADLYLPGDTTMTQYDLFSNLGSGIKREDYVHIIDEYWVD